jgi:hypothetical protein
VLICAAGDIHGAINRFYDDVLAFEMCLGGTFEWVLHVGDFGIWPDPERIDRAARCHDGAGDFSEWLRAGRGVPRQTIFIKGNHEDFAWLESQMHTDAELAGVPCIGLNKVARPGNLIAIEIDPGRRTWSILAEYPPPDQAAKRLEALEELTRLSQELGLGSSRRVRIPLSPPDKSGPFRGSVPSG